MSDPQEPLKLLAIPSHGSDVDTWDQPVNADFTAIGGMLGGFATISLTNAPVTLTKPTGTATPGAGPTQSQNARVTFTGTLTGNCVVTFPLPGFYIVRNNCTVGAFYVQASCGAGNKVGLPPGKSVHIFCDGTDVEFVDMPDVGSYMDYAGSIVPAWITACSVVPWLVCDGATALIATYPQLAAILGTTFGGNGINTFGLPDLRNRSRLMIDTNQGGFSNRVTSAGSGINGQSLGASGGDQSLQQHTHVASVTDPGHSHTIGVAQNAPSGGVGGATPGPTNVSTSSNTTGISVANANAGVGTGQNMPPALIAGLTFIRAG